MMYLPHYTKLTSLGLLHHITLKSLELNRPRNMKVSILAPHITVLHDPTMIVWQRTMLCSGEELSAH